MSILQIERVAALQPHSIVLYKSFPASAGQTAEASLHNLEKGKAGEYNGYMSPATGRKVRKYLSSWLLALEQNMKDRAGRGTKYYPTFVTLTLASEQRHTDNEIKRNMLNRFIIRIQKTYGVKYFFWRAEPQENANIHFHLIIDRWISWPALRAEWNKIQDENGYIEPYRKAQQGRHLNGFKLEQGSKRSEAQQRKAYEEGVGCNWSNPNSTDVHRISNLDSLTAYVVKYVCKSDALPISEEQPVGEEQPVAEVGGARRKIQGRIWGCSDELRDFTYYADTHSVEMDFTTHGNSEMVNYVAEVEKAVGKAEVYEDDFIKVIRLKKPQAHYLERYAPTLHYRYKQYYRNIYKRLYEENEKEPISEPKRKEVGKEEKREHEIVQLGCPF